MLTQSLPIAQISDPIAWFAGTAFKVEEQNGSVIAITTPFKHIYGDPIVLYLSTQSDGSILITTTGKLVNGSTISRNMTLIESSAPLPLSFGYWEPSSSRHK